MSWCGALLGLVAMAVGHCHGNTLDGWATSRWGVAQIGVMWCWTPSGVRMARVMHAEGGLPMFDRCLRGHLDGPLARVAAVLDRRWITPDRLTVAGLVLGLVSAGLAASHVRLDAHRCALLFREQSLHLLRAGLSASHARLNAHRCSLLLLNPGI